MNNDESFNDSDEITSLYSSKKTTEAFKTQFQKLLSNYSSQNGETKIQTNENSNDSHTALTEDKKKDKVSAILDITLDDNSQEDSVEIIEEPVVRRTRRSERLRYRNPFLDVTVCSDVCNPTPVPIRRKKPMRRTRGKKKKVDEIVLDVSQDSDDNLKEDELNPEVSVKVIWKSVNIKKFMMRKFQKMSKIFEELSEEEHVPQSQILLTFNNVRVKPDDTPDSLNLEFYHFLDGGVLLESKRSCDLSDSKESNPSNNCITLKFQDSNKKVLKILVGKDQKIKVAMIKCSEQLETPLKNIKFFFDGEPLVCSETPSSLGLENDEIIDIKIVD